MSCQPRGPQGRPGGVPAAPIPPVGARRAVPPQPPPAPPPLTLPFCCRKDWMEPEWCTIVPCRAAARQPAASPGPPAAGGGSPAARPAPGPARPAPARPAAPVAMVTGGPARPAARYGGGRPWGSPGEGGWGRLRAPLPQPQPRHHPALLPLFPWKQARC